MGITSIMMADVIGSLRMNDVSCAARPQQYCCIHDACCVADCCTAVFVTHLLVLQADMSADDISDCDLDDVLAQHAGVAETLQAWLV
jgi:hypothetical protein